ncbi:hypothetical protein BG005_010399, partial [Podila minutissima]
MTSKTQENTFSDPSIDPETSSVSRSATLVQPAKKRLFGIFIVNDNISYLNFCSYLIAFS